MKRDHILGALIAGLLILALVSQCQSGTAKAEALEHQARGDAYADLLATRDAELEDERAALDALRDTTDALRAETAIALVEATESGRRAAVRVDELLDEVAEVAGDSVATVMVVGELRASIDSLTTAHVVEVDLLESQLAIVWRRVEATDDLLAQQIDLTSLAESALAEYRTGVERAIQALNARDRRNKLLQGAAVIAVVVALIR